MAFYPCKICGNPMDPIYSDGICDDCYFGQSSFLPLKNDKKSRASSRSASSGKKKKSKIQKAAALIMAMMIALSSLCLCSLAGAEVVSGVFQADYTYMGYDVAEFNIDQRISGRLIKSMYDRYFPTYSTKNYLAMYLLEFDAQGKPYIYCTSGRIGNTSNFTWQFFSPYEGAYWISMDNYSMDVEQIGTSYNYIDITYNTAHTHIRWQNLNSTTEDAAAYSIDKVNGETGVYTGNFVSDTRYLVFVPYNLDETNVNSILSSLLNGTREEDFKEPDPEPEAGFITAKTPEEGKITVIDWVGAGTQYPLFDFWIDDNHCYDKYVLRISSNDTYAQSLLDKGKVDNGLDWIGYSTAFSTQQISLAFQMLNYNKLQWDIVRNITDTTFTFAETDKSNRRGYTICLSDYFSVVEYLLYKAEIIDQTTGKLVAVTYFSTNRTYDKGSSGFGSQVSHYTDDNDEGWDMDMNDGKFGNADEQEKKEQMTIDNKNDIVINYDPQVLNLDSFTDSLSGLISNVGSFFNACWGLFPPEIMTIICLGLSLLVTCGVIKFFVG